MHQCEKQWLLVVLRAFACVSATFAISRHEISNVPQIFALVHLSTLPRAALSAKVSDVACCRHRVRQQ